MIKVNLKFKNVNQYKLWINLIVQEQIIRWNITFIIEMILLILIKLKIKFQMISLYIIRKN